MAQPELETPIPQPQDAEPNPSTPSDEPIQQQDPLLDSGAFIDVVVNDAAPENEQTPNVEFKPGEVINAVPISVVAPSDGSEEATPKAAVKKSAEERPSWLPENWTYYTKTRASGASAGTVDRYYVEPSGQRRFRSKNEVFRFLETGVKPSKRKLAPEGDANPSEDSVNPKQKKSSAKRKKSKASKSEPSGDSVKPKQKQKSSAKSKKSKSSKSAGVAPEVQVETSEASEFDVVTPEGISKTPEASKSEALTAEVK